MRKSPRIRFWEETTLSLWDGLTLINCGGHFEGVFLGALLFAFGSYVVLNALGLK